MTDADFKKIMHGTRKELLSTEGVSTRASTTEVKE